MSDEEINLADPAHDATVIAQWDGQSVDPKSNELMNHWASDISQSTPYIDFSTACWIWIKFARPSWVFGAKVRKANHDSYPSLFAGYYSTDNAHQMVSLFEERKIMLSPSDELIEKGIAPVYTDNILLIFDKFSNPEKPYLPKLEDIQVMGYFD